jgi:non-ribosomal peptide synthase protein (TIGR01720 family)
MGTATQIDEARRHALREQLTALTPAQREMLAARLSPRAAQPRLVAAVVTKPGSELVPEVLRDWLRARLPEYMTPAVIEQMTALPSLPNGKVDRTALARRDWVTASSTPAGASPQAADADTAALEQTLAGIWSAVLDVNPIDRADNFFELGGDSILVIKIVSRAARAGLTIKPRQIFDNPTIAGLAAALAATTQVTPAAAKPAQAAKAAVADVPCTPIQHWFFEQGLTQPQHWNQALALESAGPIDATRMSAAVLTLLRRHAALRTRFAKTAGEWRQQVADAPAQAPFERHDLSALNAADRDAQMAAIADRLHASLDIAQPRLLAVAQFDLGAISRVLVIAHHLAVDTVSWAMLLEDLQAAYLQPAVALAPETAPFAAWSEALRSHAQSAAVMAEREYWSRPCYAAVPAMPMAQAAGANTVASARAVHSALTVEETQALLQDVAQAYQTQINDVLFTAFAQTLAEWCGGSEVVFDVEGHGREALSVDIDVTRTVGWFTSCYPIALTLPAGGAADVLAAVKAQLRALPGRGIGYGLLRYLGDPGTRAALGAQPRRQALFAYHGRFDAAADAGSALRAIDAPIGQARHAADLRQYVLDVNCRVRDGVFGVDWAYSAALHREAEMQHLAGRFLAHLRAIIAQARLGASGAAAPEAAASAVAPAFELAELDDADLDQIARLLGD